MPPHAGMSMGMYFRMSCALILDDIMLDLFKSDKYFIRGVNGTCDIGVYWSCN